MPELLPPHIMLMTQDVLLGKALENLLPQCGEVRISVSDKHIGSADWDVLMLDYDTLPDTEIHGDALVLHESSVPAGNTGTWLEKPLSLESLLTALQDKLTPGMHARDRVEITSSCALILHSRMLSYQNKEIELTEKEVQMLNALHDEPEGIARKHMLEQVWGYKADVETSTLETHLYRLRRKLEQINAPFSLQLEEGILRLETSK